MPDLSLIAKFKCADCFHAKVSTGEICHCSEGEWKNRELKNVERIYRHCGTFEAAE